MCEPCDVVFTLVGSGENRQNNNFKKRKKNMELQTEPVSQLMKENHVKEILAAPLAAFPGTNTIVQWWSHIGCCKSPLETPKNQRHVPMGGIGRAGRALRAPALMDVVLNQYVFRKFSLFHLPHHLQFANCHVCSCSADDWLFKKASGKVERAFCTEGNVTHGRC